MAMAGHRPVPSRPVPSLTPPNPLTTSFFSEARTGAPNVKAAEILSRTESQLFHWKEGGCPIRAFIST